MNEETNRHIVVARTEEEVYDKLEQLKLQGYSESDIHVISNDRNHMHTLNRHSEVSTHEAGSFMDKFKSWFTGEDAVKEGLLKLNLSEAESERYAQDIASGGFVLFMDNAPIQNEASEQNEFEKGYDTFGSTGNSYESYHGDERPVQTLEPGFEDRQAAETASTEETAYTSTAGTAFVASRFSDPEPTELPTEHTSESAAFAAEKPTSSRSFSRDESEQPKSDYSKEQGFTPSTNEFVNETDGRFDEPQDRFARGETFATNPYLAREPDHIGHSMQEDRIVQSHRPTITESITSKSQTDGYQSPGADPNLGPAAFGTHEEEFETEKNSDNERTFKQQENGESLTVTDSYVADSNDQLYEKENPEKYSGNIPPSNRLF